jgi:hypothetical protein
MCYKHCMHTAMVKMQCRHKVIEHTHQVQLQKKKFKHIIECVYYCYKIIKLDFVVVMYLKASLLYKRTTSYALVVRSGFMNIHNNI